MSKKPKTLTSVESEGMPPEFKLNWRAFLNEEESEILAERNRIMSEMHELHAKLTELDARYVSIRKTATARAKAAATPGKQGTLQ